MLKFAANLSLLFTEQPFYDRFAAAAHAGFRGVEYLFPYPFDKNRLVEQLQRHALIQVLHNLPAGNWEQGERGIACHPERVGEFQDGVGLAIDYATALGCRQVNCLAGIAPAGVDPERLYQTLVDNLRFAAARLKDAGIRLLIEPINTHDMPGFYLNRSQQALALLDDVASDNLYLQYDIYHMQVMEGNLAPTIAAHIHRIAHFQFADNPGRHEPGTGEIHYPFLFARIAQLGYDGWLSAEYKPKTDTVAGLAWFAPWRAV